MAEDIQDVLGFKFTSNPIAPNVRSLVSSACARLSGLRGRDFAPGRIVGCSAKSGATGFMEFVMVLDSSRPPWQEVICVDAAARHGFLPSAVPVDFLTVANALGLSTPRTRAALHALVTVQKGAYYHHCAPVDVSTPPIAAACGLDPALLLAEQWENAWWQPWGGLLYRFSFDARRDPPLIEYQELRGGTGWCKHLKDGHGYFLR